MSCILKSKITYAIMPVGKEKLFRLKHQNKDPRAATRGSSYLIFLNGKIKPLGLLPFIPQSQAICKYRRLLYLPELRE